MTNLNYTNKEARADLAIYDINPLLSIQIRNIAIVIKDVTRATTGEITQLVAKFYANLGAICDYYFVF